MFCVTLWILGRRSRLGLLSQSCRVPDERRSLHLIDSYPARRVMRSSHDYAMLGRDGHGLAEALADYVPKDVGQRLGRKVESGDSMKWLLEDRLRPARWVVRSPDLRGVDPLPCEMFGKGFVDHGSFPIMTTIVVSPLFSVWLWLGHALFGTFQCGTEDTLANLCVLFQPLIAFSSGGRG
jgi:hypothetical protein